MALPGVALRAEGLEASSLAIRSRLGDLDAGTCELIKSDPAQ